MPKEVPTHNIIADIFNHKDKCCYLPKVYANNDGTGQMKMKRVYSTEDVSSLPRVQFKTFSLVEPNEEYRGKSREDRT